MWHAATGAARAVAGNASASAVGRGLRRRAAGTASDGHGGLARAVAQRRYFSDHVPWSQVNKRDFTSWCDCQKSAAVLAGWLALGLVGRALLSGGGGGESGGDNSDKAAEGGAARGGDGVAPAQGSGSGGNRAPAAASPANSS